ncbi:MAG: serine/threonine-protein kinase [Proteobacteria bacterium]|nr:serine/threonine-protein kinase [Pseudomonadota bacterium]
MSEGEQRGFDKGLRKNKVIAGLFGDAPTPIKIGRYVLLERIGAGGMGEVYTAYDDQLDRKIAIKVVHAGAGTDAEARLLREARVLAVLSHPNVVQVYEAGTFKERVFIAMEYIRGVSLTEKLKATRALPRQARLRAILDYFIAAGRGLEAAHQNGLVHRDFKPDNVLVGDDGRVRVLDFGLARMLDPAGDKDSTDQTDAVPKAALLLTASGTIMGTPAFMAPEQFMGQRASSHSDQFSFCVALYQALLGDLPFKANSYDGIKAAVSTGKLETSRRENEIPSSIRRAIRRGLSTEQDQRFPTMAGLLAVLESWPRRRLQLRLLTVVLIVTALVGTIAYNQKPSGSVAVCQGAEQELAPVWNADRRAVLKRTIMSIGLPYKEEAWSLIAPGLDKYAKEWTVMHHEACMAHQRGYQSDELLDKRMTCLAQRRDALASARDVLAEIRAEHLYRAVNVVKQLPYIDYCADIKALTSEIPPPGNPEIARRVSELRQRLRRVESLEGNGRYREARELSEELSSQAEKLEYPPLLAELLLAWGRSMMKESAGPRTIEILDRATTVALQAGVESIAAEALARSIHVRSVTSDDEQVVPALSRIAQALSHDRAFVHALVLNNTGNFHWNRKQYERARSLFERAIAAVRGTPAAEHPEVLEFQANLAMATADPNQLLRLLKQLADKKERILGPNHPDSLDMRMRYAQYQLTPRQAARELEHQTG